MKSQPISAADAAEAKNGALYRSDLSSPWHRQVGKRGWRALSGALITFIFENFDIFLLSLTIPALIVAFNIERSEAGLVASVTSAGLIVGGIAGGWLADRIGRVKVLGISILIYAGFTGLIAIASNIVEVGAFRFLAGLGIGAGWTAGAALVAETWPAKHRGKGGALMQAGLPIGSLLAVGVALMLSAETGSLDDDRWRILYLVGAAPMLLAIYVWLFVPESDVWRADRAKRVARSAEAKGAEHGAIVGSSSRRNFGIAFVFVFCVQYIYYAVFTFAPTFLIAVRDLTLTTSYTYVVVQQAGSLCGFLLFGALVDRIGRRPTFIAFLIGGAVATGLFVTLDDTIALYILSFFLGMGIAGVYAGLGPWTAEMMHAAPRRATAMGLIYNGGRIGGAVAPFLVGALAVTTQGFVVGMLTTVVAFVVAIIAMLLSRETKGLQLGA